MKTFDTLWHEITHRGIASLVQNYDELKAIYELIKDCRSYLEIGAAEGNSFYVLSNAIKNPLSLSYVDYGENGTTAGRQQIAKWLETTGTTINAILGNSHSRDCISKARSFAPYDAVMIDAGHKYEDVIADAMVYGDMAKKYIIFHDIMLDDVSRAFDWFCEKQNHKKTHKIIHTNDMGYGVIKL